MDFPSPEAERAWHNDPDYGAPAEIRQAIARTNLAILEGI
jgi:uncharacterized protein (DUF1330 family)